jgi:hypothetical protein
MCIPVRSFSFVITGILALGVGLWFPSALCAQSQAINGTIEGVVQAQNHQPVPRANVQTIHTGTGYERTVTTDEAGRYSVPLLPPGGYVVRVTANGFAGAKRENLQLSAGQVLTIEFNLSISTLTESLEVKAQSLTVEVGRTVVSQTVEERTVRALPTIGRNIQDFFITQPGVNSVPPVTTGSATTTAVTVYGGLGLRQQNVDGVSNNVQGGARNLVISQESIAEFQTVTNFSAEFGRVAGGLQNAITRSGSNNLHGSAYFFTRQKFLSASPFLTAPGTPKPDFSRYNFGGTLGGPLVKNRAFYFLNYERWQQDEPVVSTFSAAAAARLGIPSENIGAFKASFRAHTLTAKNDLQLSPDHRLSTRYFFYYDRESPNTFGGAATKDVATRFDESPQSFTTQLISIFGPNMLNEARFLFASRGISNGISVNPNNPNISLSGIGNFNGNANGTRITRERGFQFIDNLSLTRGAHFIKLGFDLLPARFKERTTNINGTFTFGGLAAVTGVRGAVSPLDQFLLTEARTIDPATNRPYSYSRFTRSVGQEFFESLTINQGYFAQDDYRLSHTLKLSFGLRYERFTRPDANPNPNLPGSGLLPEDTNNWAPRFALAWDPFGKGQTVLRAGYGVFYNIVTPQTYNTLRRSNGLDVINLNVAPTSPGAPVFSRGPVPPTTGVTGVVSDVRIMDPKFQDITVQHWFLTAEHELFRDYSLALSYQGNHATHLPVSSNTNLAPAGTLPDGRRRWSTTGRPNPLFGNIFVASSIGFQKYNALIATLTKRFSKGFSVQGSYHWSKTSGAAFANDATGFGIFTAPSDPLNLRVDRGRGDFDMPHRFTLTAVIEPHLSGLARAADFLLNHWQLASRLVATKGFSFNAVTGRDDNGDTVFNDRPVGIPYNAFRVPGYYTFDLRLSRRLRFTEHKQLELIVEGFNLNNHLLPRGASDINTTWGIGATPNASFGQILRSEASRQFQLAARFTF